MFVKKTKKWIKVVDQKRDDNLQFVEETPKSERRLGKVSLLRWCNRLRKMKAKKKHTR
jgi:hypothetical protein